MNWQSVALASVPASPWRNGGGVTRELTVWPGQGEWQWRMSVAEVNASGPFSVFEGIDRWFAVLEGAGVELTVMDSNTLHTTHTPPFLFDGGATTTCRLINGHTRDFNLMVRRGSAPSRMVRVAESFVSETFAPKIIAIFAMDTWVNVLFDDESVRVPPHTLVWTTAEPGQSIRVQCSQALFIEIPV